MNFVLILFSFFTIFSKNNHFLKVTEAQRTQWAGGIAGRKGEFYDIRLETVRKEKNIQLDSIWVNDKCYPLIERTNEAAFYANFSMQKEKGKVVYKIHLRVDLSQYNYPEPEKEEHYCPPKPVEGLVAISYLRKKKKYYLSINELKEGAFRAYP